MTIRAAMPSTVQIFWSVGCVSSEGAVGQQRQPTASQLLTSHDVIIVCFSKCCQPPMPPGTVTCPGAVLRLDAVKAFGCQLHPNGYLAGFKMTSE